MGTVVGTTTWTRLAERDKRATAVVNLARLIVPRLEDVEMVTSTLALLYGLKEAVEEFDALEARPR